MTCQILGKKYVVSLIIGAQKILIHFVIFYKNSTIQKLIRSRIHQMSRVSDPDPVFLEAGSRSGSAVK